MDREREWARRIYTLAAVAYSRNKHTKYIKSKYFSHTPNFFSRLRSGNISRAHVPNASEARLDLSRLCALISDRRFRPRACVFVCAGVGCLVVVPTSLVRASSVLLSRIEDDSVATRGKASQFGEVTPRRRRNGVMGSLVAGTKRTVAFTLFFLSLVRFVSSGDACACAHF